MKHPLRYGAAVAAATLLLGTGLATAQAGDTTPRKPDNSVAEPQPMQAVASLAGISPVVTEDSYVSVTPCRIVDTRAAVGPIGAGVTRTYYVGGTTNFVPQGGKSGGCGIPVGATSVSAIVTSLAASAKGYLRAFPSNKSEPTATVLSYPGKTDVGTGATISIDPATANSLKVKNYGSSTGLVIDVTGYTIPPIAAVIAYNGTQYSGTSRILSVSKVGTGSYDVVVDRSVAGCQPNVTMHGGNYYASGYEVDGADKVHIQTWSLDADAAAVPVDLYVTMTLTC